MKNKHSSKRNTASSVNLKDGEYNMDIEWISTSNSCGSTKGDGISRTIETKGTHPRTIKISIDSDREIRRKKNLWSNLKKTASTTY